MKKLAKMPSRGRRGKLGLLKNREWERGKYLRALATNYAEIHVGTMLWMEKKECFLNRHGRKGAQRRLKKVRTLCAQNRVCQYGHEGGGGGTYYARHKAAIRPKKMSCAYNRFAEKESTSGGVVNDEPE